MADAEVSPASVPSADGDGGAAQHDVKQCAAAADHTGSPSPPAQPLDDTTWAVEPLQAVRGLLHHLRYIQTFTLEAVRRRRSSSVTDEPSTGAAPHPARVPSSAPRPGRKRARSQSADSTAHSLNDPLWVRHPSPPTVPRLRSFAVVSCFCVLTAGVWSDRVQAARAELCGAAVYPRLRGPCSVQRRGRRHRLRRRQRWRQRW